MQYTHLGLHYAGQVDTAAEGDVVLDPATAVNAIMDLLSSDGALAGALRIACPATQFLLNLPQPCDRIHVRVVSRGTILDGLCALKILCR